jgi:hypothetical protein
VAPQGPGAGRQELVKRLKEDGRSEPGLHREVFRPWGSYDSVDSPSASRSSGCRSSRARACPCRCTTTGPSTGSWWGTARITRGEETFLLTENESTYIPMGAVHRIENPGKVPLDIIEVQSGSYLGEDDIVRYEDRYGAWAAAAMPSRPAA